MPEIISSSHFNGLNNNNNSTQHQHKTRALKFTMKGDSILAPAPSFSSYSSIRFAEIATKVSNEFHHQREELGLEPIQEIEQIDEDEEQCVIPDVNVSTVDPAEIEGEQLCDNHSEDEDDEEFEFAVLSRDSSTSCAEEIFSNGQIKPIYPVFNRDLLFAGGEDDFTKLRNGATIRVPLKNLFVEDRDHSCSSSEADELEAAPEGTYCVWAPKQVQPSPERCKKSNSTGSSKRWRLRNLLNRSNSDGKDAYVYLTPSSSKSSKNVERKTETSSPGRKINSGETGKPKGKTTVASAHEVHYVRNRAIKESDRRRSYLPYRQDLVGLFGNSNSLNRALRPF